MHSGIIARLGIQPEQQSFRILELSPALEELLMSENAPM